MSPIVYYLISGALGFILWAVALDAMWLAVPRLVAP
jgi:hypothetical protein